MFKGNKDSLANCKKQINLINTFRRLWQEHILWTRLFIISTVSELADLPLVTQRLLRNPNDFAAVLSKYYGSDKSNRFAALLKDHLLIAAKLVNDAKAGNKKAADADRTQWYKNADDIAEFLAIINPYWSKKEWQKMLYDHLMMTENEATYRLTSQYSADIAEYDKIQNQALKMADYMAEGIQKQFFS